MAREPQGRFWGIPYNWSRPSAKDLARDVWDPSDDRILPPKTYGWGYGLNLAAVVKRLRRR